MNVKSCAPNLMLNMSSILKPNITVYTLVIAFWGFHYNWEYIVMRLVHLLKALQNGVVHQYLDLCYFSMKRMQWRNLFYKVQLKIASLHVVHASQ